MTIGMTACTKDVTIGQSRILFMWDIHYVGVTHGRLISASSIIWYSLFLLFPIVCHPYCLSFIIVCHSLLYIIHHCLPFPIVYHFTYIVCHSHCWFIIVCHCPLSVIVHCLSLLSFPMVPTIVLYIIPNCLTYPLSIIHHCLSFTSVCHVPFSFPIVCHHPYISFPIFSYFQLSGIHLVYHSSLSFPIVSSHIICHFVIPHYLSFTIVFNSNYLSFCIVCPFPLYGLTILNLGRFAPLTV